MTGFARVSGRVNDGLAWNLSLKSVNHRFLDLHMRMPPGAEQLEMRLRRLLKEKVLRGHLEVTLTVERGLRPSAHFDRDLLQGYIAAFRAAAAETSLQQQPDLNAIFRLPGVLTGETRFSEEEMQALEEEVAGQIDPLVEALNRMRGQEGASLAKELGATMERLDTAVSQVAHMRHEVQKAYFERISQRISGLLNGNAVSTATAYCRKRPCLPSAAMWRKRSPACAPTSSISIRCYRPAARWARSSISCCRR